MNVLEGSAQPLFLEIPEFPSNTVYDKPREASVPKTSSICSAIFVQCRLMTEMGQFIIVKGHSRSLEILEITPFDRAHTSSY